MHKIFNFRIPSEIIFSTNSCKTIIDKILSLSAKKIFIVTDKIIEKACILNNFEKALSKSNIEFTIYDGVLGEPTTDYVEEGLKKYKKNGSDIIIAIGGGSIIDTAKAISVMTSNPGTISRYKGLGKIKRKGAPVIAIPTTAGTGSEVTPYTIITDTKSNVKMLIGSEHIIPEIAIVDSTLTLSCPKELSASVGIDALTHAIEAFVSVKANPFSDLFALKAIELISTNLKTSINDVKNIQARKKVMLGATMAGIAFGNSSVALVHGMSRPLGAYFHIPHGLSNAILLAVVMEYSYNGNISKYADIAVAMGKKTTGLSRINAAKLAMKSVKKLIKELKIPTLSQLGIEKKRLEELSPEMAKAAIDSGSPANNPKVATKEDIIKLYIKAY